ncbi:MAG: HEAT repeat domain-containing protein, partial [Methanomicrobiales archaeon]|nr:HEAT repeat domain-containing protein [Methanomicrobiales archaeon]
VDALIRALNGTDSDLQSGAARALGYIGDERAVSSLIEAMGSEDFTVRRIAIDALTGIGENAIPYLSEALLHSERRVRSGAAECFGQVGYEPASEQERINLLVANEEWLEITRMGASAVDVLIYFTDDANEEVRAGAVAALGRVGGSKAVTTLAGILTSDNPDARLEAMNALADMGQKAVPELVEIKKEAKNPVQLDAIEQILDLMRRRTPPRQAAG